MTNDKIPTSFALLCEKHGGIGGTPPNERANGYPLFTILTRNWLMMVDLLVIHWGVSPQTPRIVFLIRKFWHENMGKLESRGGADTGTEIKTLP